jgi:hypothetical protein
VLREGAKARLTQDRPEQIQYAVFIKIAMKSDHRPIPT